MHQEVSKKEGVSFFKLVVAIFGTATVLILINTLLVTFGLNSAITDTIIIIATAVLSFGFIKKNMISYKYCLIEDEFIITEMIGSKEKRVLNMNLSQVEAFANTKDPSYGEVKNLSFASKKKLYNCDNSQNRCYVVYEEENQKKIFTIQPSDFMAELISERI